MDKVYNKLVRDKIPEIIRNNGEEPVVRILNENDYKKELQNKLYEEYQEVIEAKMSEDRIEELADMIEIIRALAKIENKSLFDVIKVADKKCAKRGGFEQRIFLEKVLCKIPKEGM